MTIISKQQKRGHNSVWIIPVVLVIILIVCAGGYYAYGSYETWQDQKESSAAESSRQEELAAMREVLDQDVFYSGLFIDDIDLSGKSYSEAQTELEKRNQAWRESINLNIVQGGQSWPLTAEKAGLSSNWHEVLDEAWNIGRTSDQQDEEAQVRERYAIVAGLQTSPRHLEISRSYDEAAVRGVISGIADYLTFDPVEAKATGFDLSTRTFIIEEPVPGQTADGEACLANVLKLLDAGSWGQAVEMPVQPVSVGRNAADLQDCLGFVSEGKTYARKINVNRDHNIKLICQSLNGLVLQPGETFSFNGYIGKRTAAKGYREAGGIKDGILVAELGGGICQPNTTLCHAVLMADLEIVERHPHSWPSDYVKVGLDATVSWNGPDFKFKNNTEYPIAIAAWYDKPEIVVQIYGRQLENGAAIFLEAVHNGYIPVGEPTENLNSDLKPGQRVEVRAAHIGQRATAYKVWKIGGKVVKRELAFTSYYRPLSAIYQYGPPLPTSPPKPTVAPTPSLPPEPEETAAG